MTGRAMTGRSPVSRLRRTGVVVGAGALVALGMLAPATGASAGAPADAPAGVVTAASTLAAAAAPDDDGYRQTKTVSRSVLDAQGAEDPRYSRSLDMTVTVDKTTQLRGRERVQISWTGAPASGGRAANPYGEKGLQQEYPVVILQCRGVDDASLPEDEQLSPETCWTTSAAQRSRLLRSASDGLWTVDRFNDGPQRARYVGPESPQDKGCTSDYSAGSRFTRLVPFQHADGRSFVGCNITTMPPEAAVDAAFPAADVASFTDPAGNGSALFEVRTAVENESLGCTDEVACSIVVIPILGISCDAPTPATTSTDNACRKSGQWPVGSGNYASEGIDNAVGPALWWSESNWRNRFSVPIEFGLPPDVCDILDPRAPVPVYGSELMSQAALQWSPAYCLNEKRFKFQAGAMADQAAWDLMETAQAPAAFVAVEHETEGADRVGYAPTAVTGFSVSYIIDKPENGGEYVDLRLNARLIAKMITQSYLGSDLGRLHPGMEGNWLGIMADPEFQALNPGLSTQTRADAANLMSLSINSDVIESLTAYIAQDEDAMAFIGGEPDAAGMVVNPAYEDIELPRSDWPLLDEFVPTTNDECRKTVGGVYFSDIAAPVTTLRKISDALIDAWPLAQTVCNTDLTDPDNTVYSLKRADRQNFGARFLMGITTLGDAERFGLTSAALRNGKTYVEPTTSSLARAVAVGEQVEKYGPFDLDAEQIAAARGAYPGTMIVYTAARLTNLEQAQADTVSRFITIATTEGQRPGRGNGQLPEGYLPIRASGVTAPLFAAAQETAAAIAAQGEKPDPEDPDPEDPDPEDPDATDPPGGNTDLPGTVDDPTDDDTDGPGDNDPAGDDDTTETVTVATDAASSGWGTALLPALLIIGLLAAASSLTSWFLGSRSGNGP